MLIAHVLFRVQPAQAEAALTALRAEVPVVRAMPGCEAFILFLDPSDPGAVGILHEWQTPEAFAAYTASPGFAGIGKVLRPLMISPPVSKRFDAQSIETLGRVDGFNEDEAECNCDEGAEVHGGFLTA